MRNRTCIIWTIDSKIFKRMVSENSCYSHILKSMGLRVIGGFYKILKQRIKEENIDDTHIKNYVNRNAYKNFQEAIPLKDVLIKDSTYSRCSLKRRLLKDGLLKNECSICGSLPIWNNKELILILDHINGIHNDNRIENLRMICPNCNSQTDTFSGRNTHRIKKKIHCKKCNELIESKNKNGICRECWIKTEPTQYQTRFEISKEELEKLVWEVPMIKIGEMFKVSGNAVKKRCKKLGISFPSRGYWVKKLYGKL
jgi:Zn finger protein HypA/HybF involved in hydrogenase expression